MTSVMEEKHKRRKNTLGTGAHENGLDGGRLLPLNDRERAITANGYGQKQK